MSDLTLSRNLRPGQVLIAGGHRFVRVTDPDNRECMVDIDRGVLSSTARRGHTVAITVVDPRPRQYRLSDLKNGALFWLTDDNGAPLQPLYMLVRMIGRGVAMLDTREWFLKPLGDDLEHAQTMRVLTCASADLVTEVRGDYCSRRN